MNQYSGPSFQGPCAAVQRAAHKVTRVVVEDVFYAQFYVLNDLLRSLTLLLGCASRRVLRMPPRVRLLMSWMSHYAGTRANPRALRAISCLRLCRGASFSIDNVSI